MLTAQERAHDLAVAFVQELHFKNMDSFPSQTVLFDVSKDYEHAYKGFLDSFESV